MKHLKCANFHGARCGRAVSAYVTGFILIFEYLTLEAA